MSYPIAIGGTFLSRSCAIDLEDPSLDYYSTVTSNTQSIIPLKLDFYESAARSQESGRPESRRAGFPDRYLTSTCEFAHHR